MSGQRSSGSMGHRKHRQAFRASPMPRALRQRICQEVNDLAEKPSRVKGKFYTSIREIMEDR